MFTVRPLAALASALLLTVAGCDSGLAYQPDAGVPIQFTVDSSGHFAVQLVKSIVTPIGKFELTSDVAATPEPPDGITWLYIDHDVHGVRWEDRFELKTSREMDVQVDGRAVLKIRERFIRVTAQDDITTIFVGPAGSFGAGKTSKVELDDIVQFGTSTSPFPLAWQDGVLTISPPLGPDRYAALWGGYFPGDACGVDIEFDVEVVPSPENAPNRGFAVAPRAVVSNDRPTGASVQYEQESPPDFPRRGSYVRPAHLPDGAWAVEAPPMTAPDVNDPHHVRVTAMGDTIAIQIDGRNSGMYRRAGTCGGVAFRAWGAAFRFRHLAIAEVAAGG